MQGILFDAFVGRDGEDGKEDWKIEIEGKIGMAREMEMERRETEIAERNKDRDKGMY
jgi:hypothetical protein